MDKMPVKKIEKILIQSKAIFGITFKSSDFWLRVVLVEYESPPHYFSADVWTKPINT